jgi:hypothetical protein
MAGIQYQTKMFGPIEAILVESDERRFKGGGNVQLFIDLMAMKWALREFSVRGSEVFAGPSRVVRR